MKLKQGIRDALAISPVILYIIGSVLIAICCRERPKEESTSKDDLSEMQKQETATDSLPKHSSIECHADNTTIEIEEYLTNELGIELTHEQFKDIYKIVERGIEWFIESGDNEEYHYCDCLCNDCLCQRD